jgi:hypothetical protein
MEVMLIVILPRNEQILIAILKGMAEAIERLRECYGEPSSTERGRTRPLNRILKAAKMRREPVWAFSEQNEKWGAVLERVGRLYKIEGDAALKPGARRPGAARVR